MTISAQVIADEKVATVNAENSTRNNKIITYIRRSAHLVNPEFLISGSEKRMGGTLENQMTKQINGDRDYILSLQQKVKDLKQLAIMLAVLLISVSVCLYVATEAILNIIK